ncbi:MAG: alpha/beta hydrolase [Acidimicrobiia bacterium]
MRAREPDHHGFVDSDGLDIGYEVFGSGDPTVLLLPTWTIMHARFWKMQVPYLSRGNRVVTYDGPGNGRTVRSSDPERFSTDAEVANAVAVLDAVGADRAVVVGYSDGGKFGARMAQLHPGRVSALILIAPNLGLDDPLPERDPIRERFFEPYPENPEGWEKFNAAYWRDHYDDFARFFMGKVFSEPFSTKQWDDGVGWALETTGAILEAEMRRPADPDPFEVASAVSCPVLLIHGTDDRIIPHQGSVRAAEVMGASLLTMAGSGHGAHLRDPIPVNLALREFIDGVTP